MYKHIELASSADVINTPLNFVIFEEEAEFTPSQIRDLTSNVELLKQDSEQSNGV